MTPWPHGDPNVVARAILAQPAYRQTQPPDDPTSSWLQSLVDIIGKALQRLFGGVHVPVHGVWTATQVLGIVLLIAAGLGIAVLAYRVIASWANAGPRAARTQRVPLDARGSAADMRAAAAEVAQRGEYAHAVGLLFRAALLGLDAAGAVAFDAARTPGEYRRLVRARAGEAAAPFDELSARFVHASFAARAPSRREFEAARLALTRLDAALTAAGSLAA
ncbi:MAG: DUF4129 domain-containing protein [Candidatus Baltobacteraceae bacterium]